MTDFLRAQVDPFDAPPMRFGADEEDLERLLLSLSFGTQIPGGFGDGRVVFPRPENLSALDAKRFLRAPVRFYGAGGDTAYEGRVHGVPSIGVSDVELSTEGLAAHLADDRSVREVWIDNDLSAWGSLPPSYHRTALDTYYPIESGGSVDSAEDGVPALVQRCVFSGTQRPFSGAIYDADGLPLGSIYYSVIMDGPTAYAGGTSLYGQVTLRTEFDVAADATGDLETTSGTTGTLDATAADRIFGGVWWFWNAAATAADAEYVAFWKVLAVTGNHDLTLVGTASATQSQGLYASQIIADAVARFAPLLPIDYIEPSTYVVRQFAKKEETDVQSIIEELTALGGGASLINDWGVFSDGFFWRTPGTFGTTWRVRRDEVAEPEDEGPDATERCNGVIVTYQDPAGKIFRVGPPDAPYVDATDEGLEDTDPENPCNKDGSRTWKTVAAGLTDQGGAILIGRLALLEANADKRKGALKVSEYAYDAAGNKHPSWAIRAGDQVVVEDDDDTEPRRIVETSYDGTDVLTASVGSAPDRLGALLGRLTIGTEAGQF